MSTNHIGTNSSEMFFGYGYLVGEILFPRPYGTFRQGIMDCRCKTPTLLNVIMVVVELVRSPMIEARVD